MSNRAGVANWDVEHRDRERSESYSEKREEERK